MKIYTSPTREGLWHPVTKDGTVMWPVEVEIIPARDPETGEKTRKRITPTLEDVPDGVRVWCCPRGGRETWEVIVRRGEPLAGPRRALAGARAPRRGGGLRRRR